MLGFLKRISLNIKFLLITFLVLTVTFLFLAYDIYTHQKEVLLEQQDRLMFSKVDDLKDIFDVTFQQKEEAIKDKIRIVDVLLFESDTLRESTRTLQRRITDENDLYKKIVPVNDWVLREKSLLNNFELMDQIEEKTSCNISILQKISEGYLHITGSLLKESGKRMNGFFIPNNSIIVQTIEKGRNYIGRAKLFGHWYIVCYQPIILNGRVKGAVQVSIPDKDIFFLRKKIKKNTGNYAYASYVIDQDGFYMIHPFYEGAKMEKNNLLKSIQKNRRGKFQYLDGGVWKTDYFTYYEPYNIYTGVTVDASFIGTPLKEIRFKLWVGFGLALIVCLIGISVSVKPVSKALNKMSAILKRLSQGQRISKIHTKRKDEIGNMAAAVNELIAGFNKYVGFAQQVGKGQLESDFKPLSEDDQLGNVLIRMKEDLKLTKVEDQKRTWIAEGLRRFSELLQKNNENIKTLSTNVIKNLVEYLKASQGGIFLLNQDNPNDKHLEMLACFAYDRKKFTKKRLGINEGLIGQAFLEGSSIYMKELPDDYLHITSGLGEAVPNTILIVPLKINEEVHGIVELASLNEFDPEHIEFVEKISESIAATISSVKTTIQTKQLLRESQLLTEQLRTQEEEMRQNVEELKATQEETQKNQEETNRRLMIVQKDKLVLKQLLNAIEIPLIAIDDKLNVLYYNQAIASFYTPFNVDLKEGVYFPNLLSEADGQIFRNEIGLMGEDKKCSFNIHETQAHVCMFYNEKESIKGYVISFYTSMY